MGVDVLCDVAGLGMAYYEFEDDRVDAVVIGEGNKCMTRIVAGVSCDTDGGQHLAVQFGDIHLAPFAVQTGRRI